MKTLSHASPEAKAKAHPRDALRQQAQLMRLQADTLDALADALPDNEADELLDASQALESYGIGRDGILAAVDRGELEAIRGARKKLLVRRSEIERWIASRPVKPRPRKVEAESSIDAWEAEVERAIGGGR
jgi:hypothetical protein